MSEQTNELDALAGEAQAADQQAAPQQPEGAAPGGQVQEGEFIPAAGQLEEAERDAALIMAGASKFTEKKWGVGIGPETRATGAKKLAPLLLKYDLESPFLRKWRAEIDAAVFFGGVAYSIYEAVQLRKELEKAAKEKGNGEQQ